MPVFRNLSIRTKLTLVIMLASMLMHVCVSSVYLALEAFSSRSFLQQETATLANSLGAICKNHLLKGDEDAAANVLASLAQQQNIRAAYLFDKAARPFAEFLKKGESQFVLETLPEDFAPGNSPYWTTATELKVFENWHHVSLFMPIFHESQRIGSIYLLSDLNNLYGRLNGILLVILVASGFLLGLSYYFAGILQQPVSNPLLKLVKTMAVISQHQDYSIRAEKEGQDEIGQLVEGFNQMLNQIERHRQQLIEHQDSLEQTVAQRTTELRELVDVLEHAKQQAVLASEAKSSFLANITHELRTPLIGVLGMNELLFRTQLNDQQRKLVDKVQKSGEDLLSLINDVLDFSKIEAGELQLEVVEFSISQVVEDVLSLLTGAASEKGLTLYNDVPLEVTCKVLADEGRLRQIIMNLVGNAIKFTDSGSVTVKVSRQFVADGSDRFTLEIIDTGIGMSEVEQQQIFNAFYQSDGTSTRAHGGTGLGLSIVLKLIEQFGGSIQLESFVGVGSRFIIELPLQVVAETDFLLPEIPAKGTVLLTLADKDCQQILIRRINELGLTAVAAKSTTDAWYQIRAAVRAGRPFSLALCSSDALLPDGQPLYRAIREDASCHSLRQVVVLPFNQSVELNARDTKLYLPFSWTAFHQTLCRSMHELRLVEKPLPLLQSLSDERPPVQLNMLVVGTNVASKELLRLSLQNLPVSLVEAHPTEVSEELISAEKFHAVMIDLNSETDSALALDLDFLKAVPFLFVLHQKGQSFDQFAEVAHGRLEKPIARDSLAQLLQPVLNIQLDQPAKATPQDGA